MLVEKDYLFHDLSLHVPPSLVCNRSMVTNSVVIGSGPLSEKELIGIARHGQRIELDPAAVLAVAQTRAAIVALATDPEPHYGISTGVGALATQFIPDDQRVQLQRSEPPPFSRTVFRELLLH